MRDLASSDKNLLVIQDPRSGTELGLYYRMPTTQEEIGYRAEQITRDKKKVRVDVFGVRVKYADKIITGIRDGDFGFNGQPISSDPVSPDYRADWKALLKATAPDILSALATHIFEGARVVAPEPEVEFVGEEGADDSRDGESEAPLGSN